VDGSYSSPSSLQEGLQGIHPNPYPLSATANQPAASVPQQAFGNPLGNQTPQGGGQPGTYGEVGQFQGQMSHQGYSQQGYGQEGGGQPTKVGGGQTHPDPYIRGGSEGYDKGFFGVQNQASQVRKYAPPTSINPLRVGKEHSHGACCHG